MSRTCASCDADSGSGFAEGIGRPFACDGGGGSGGCEGEWGELLPAGAEDGGSTAMVAMEGGKGQRSERKEAGTRTSPAESETSN